MVGHTTKGRVVELDHITKESRFGPERCWEILSPSAAVMGSESVWMALSESLALVWLNNLIRLKPVFG